VNALQALATNTVARQHAIRDLQILEAVRRGVQKISFESASEETLRNLQYCSHFCRPALNRFLQSLKDLEPSVRHTLALGESPVELNPAPVWAIRLECDIAALQGSVGTGFRVIDLLLRVEALRCGLATTTTLPEDLQRTVDTLQERLHSPVKRHTGPGHLYNNIQNSGGYSHHGDKYFFNGAPLIALVEVMAKKLDSTAGMLHTGQSKSIGEDPRFILPQGVAFTRDASDNTSEPSTVRSTEMQPSTPESTQLSAMDLAKLLLQRLLELLRTELNTTLAVLLWTIPAFRIFVRCLTTITTAPCWLLDSNITLIDARLRKVSLPYQWFRNWPHMLAHLQYEFKGTPVETHISENRFGLFQRSSQSRCGQKIPLEQREDFVRPGFRVVMRLLFDIRRNHLSVCRLCVQTVIHVMSWGETKS
jgi:hypothetical protein